MHAFSLTASFQLSGYVASMDASRHAPLSGPELLEVRREAERRVNEVLSDYVVDHPGSPVQDPRVDVTCREVSVPLPECGPEGAETYGCVRIDSDCTWYLPADWEEVPDEQVLGAWALTFSPPHPVDGGYGARVLADIPEAIEEVAEGRGLCLPTG